MSNAESFESVYERLYPQLHNPCGLWKAATIAEWLDDLERAHDREIEHARKAEYHHGYEDGRRSMDAEHEHVALRLGRLRFDGGSHEGLSRIAYAVYPCATGWTPESCAGLRDRLIDLLGGVSDEPHPNLCRTSAEPDAGAIRQHDVLGNERQKAVCELRKIHADAGGFVKALAKALGVEWQAPRVHQTLANVRDRLIDLLGGDEPDFAEIAKTIKSGDECEVEPMESGENHKMATTADEPTLSDLWGAWKDADGTCPNDDGTCPNDVSTSSMLITDELRKWASTEVPYKYGRQLHAIADRIDEQFGRICMQQERVLQDTIDGAGHRLEDADKQRDELRRELDETRDALDEATGNWARATDERDQLLDLLRDARDEYMELQAKLDAMTRYNGESRFERLLELILKDSQIENLQAKLDAIRDALDA